MQAKPIAALAGGFFGAVAGFAITGLLHLTPLPDAHPATTQFISEAVTLLLLLVGAAVGIALLNRSRSRPTGPEADYDDGPPAD
jgi:hypothetical protein